MALFKASIKETSYKEIPIAMKGMVTMYVIFLVFAVTTIITTPSVPDSDQIFLVLELSGFTLIWTVIIGAILYYKRKADSLERAD